jgi:hypothetical protein
MRRVGDEGVGSAALVERPSRNCQTADGSLWLSVAPRMWIVERTLGGWGRYRRLSKDDEYLPKTSEATIYVAMIHLMVRRLARIAFS